MRLLQAMLLCVSACTTGYGPFQRTGSFPYLFVRNGLPDTLWVSARLNQEFRLLATIPPQDSTCVRIPFLGDVTFIGETRTARSERVESIEDPYVWLLTTGDASQLRPRADFCTQNGLRMPTYTAP